MALDALHRSHNLTKRDGFPPAVLLAITVLLTVLPATSTAAGTTATTFGPAVAHPFRSLHIGTWGLYVSTLNPLSITTSDDFVVTYSVRSTVTKYGKAYRVVPDLSYNWTVASDQKTWTFRIVPGATFANPSNPSESSHPVTADDVVFSYNLQIAQTGSVEHAYVQGVASVAKLDDYTVQIVTIQPYAPMLTMTSTVPILPSYIWATIANPIAYPNSAPVGSGPLYYDGVNTTASLLTLRRNPHFYGDPFYCTSPRPDEIRFINYATSAGLVSDFLAGTSGLDAIQRVALQDYKSGLARWPLKWAVANGDIAEFSVNVMTPEVRAMFPQFQTGGAYNNQLLLNHTVRDAIAMSVNKTTVVEYALLGLGEEADTLVPPANPWHYPIPEGERVQFDPAAARAALNAAGWKYDSTGALNPSATPLYKSNSADPLRFRFYEPNSDPAFAAAAVNISGWLAQTGIQTTDALGNPGYHIFTFNQMAAIWFAGNYDLWIWDWIFSPGSDISLDILFIETTMAIGATSDNFYSNVTYDSLYNQSLVAVLHGIGDDAFRGGERPGRSGCDIHLDLRRWHNGRDYGNAMGLPHLWVARRVCLPRAGLGRRVVRLRGVACHDFPADGREPPALPLRHSVPAQPAQRDEWDPVRRCCEPDSVQRHRGGPRGRPDHGHMGFRRRDHGDRHRHGYLGSTDRLADPCLQQRRNLPARRLRDGWEDRFGQSRGLGGFRADPGLASQ